jgi:hypothetical protein
LSLGSASELVSAEPATETSKSADATESQPAQATTEPTDAPCATSAPNPSVRGRANAKYRRSTDTPWQRLGEIIRKDASTANSQATKLTGNGSPACSTLPATDASLLTEALLSEALLAEALLAEARLPKATLPEATLTETTATKATATKTGVAKPSTSQAATSESRAAEPSAAKLGEYRLVGGRTKCQRRSQGCSHETRANSKSHSVHSGWLESLNEYYGTARYRRAIDEPMVFVTILPTSLGLQSLGLSSVGNPTLHPLRQASDCAH